MAWSASKIFQQTFIDGMSDTMAMNLGSDSIKVALYNNSITPSQTVSAANSAYNAGVWGSSNEQTDASGWPAGGRALGSQTWTASGGVLTFTAANLSDATGTTTLANVYGCLVYDSTLTTPVSKQGICYNYFGGVQSVTNGTFTIAWNASGILSLSL